MAKIGLKFPVASPITGYTASGMPIYSTGFIVGKAITAEKSIESNDNPLYADDAVAENDTSFAGGTIKLGVSDFGADYKDGLQVQAKMLGHTIIDSGSGIGGRLLTLRLTSVSVFTRQKSRTGNLYMKRHGFIKLYLKYPLNQPLPKENQLNGRLRKLRVQSWRSKATRATHTKTQKYLQQNRRQRAGILVNHNASRSGIFCAYGAYCRIRYVAPETYTSATWGVFYHTYTSVSENIAGKSYMGSGEVSYWTSQLTNAEAKLTERSGS